MFGLGKKEKLINLVNKYKEWLYNKTSLYNSLIDDSGYNEGNTKLTVNKHYINSLDDSEVNKWYNEIKEDIKWHKML